MTRSAILLFELLGLCDRPFELEHYFLVALIGLSSKAFFLLVSEKFSVISRLIDWRAPSNPDFTPPVRFMGVGVLQAYMRDTLGRFTPAVTSCVLDTTIDCHSGFDGASLRTWAGALIPDSYRHCSSISR
jgi:hypothetical protein